MDRSGHYYRQVQLLLQVIPFIAEKGIFALKGGTAINLFVQDLPRLSVDIDLVYLPMKRRQEALAEIKRALGDIAQSLRSRIQGVDVTESFKDRDDALRLIIARGGIPIKVELSPVLRGTVFEPVIMNVCKQVEEEFGFAEINVVSLLDLYAGKICAALDRQHPRDLFDIKWLLDNEGLTDDIREAFLIYLISHNRPMAELLRPAFKDIEDLYRGEFLDMAEVKVPLAALEDTREELIDQLHRNLTDKDREFLLRFKASPDVAPVAGMLGE